MGKFHISKRSGNLARPFESEAVAETFNVYPPGIRRRLLALRSLIFETAEKTKSVGALLLLPKSFNANYGSCPCHEKLGHYFSQNLLAKSLHPNCYERNPGFIQIISKTQLPFEPITEFTRASIDSRAELYHQIAKQVWAPDSLLQEVNG